MLSDKTAEKKEIDPDALMREYKQTGSLEARNKLVMHYIYIAQGMAVKMSSTYHKYATTEEMVINASSPSSTAWSGLTRIKGSSFPPTPLPRSGERSSTMSESRTGYPGEYGRWISVS